MKNKFIILFLVVFSSIISSVAFADKEGLLSKLLAPGQLIKGHADLEEKDCLKCHDAGKGIPDEKCLSCHKAIRPFVESKKGFHGLVNKSCMECHRDHKGRDFDSINVDKNNFDHGKKTGYVLEGKHGEIKCQECHKEKYGAKSVRVGEIRFISKPSSCVSCHKKDDVHFYKNEFAKKDCNTCHSLKSWKDNILFNHEKDARYKLEGKHSSLKCNDCHLSDKKTKTFTYKWANLKSAQCLACHENTHKSNLSSKFAGGTCTKCHGQENWKIQSFDHGITGYKLNGQHAELKCTDCHKQSQEVLKSESKKNYKWIGLKQQCLTCHEDYHKFGKIKNPHFGSLDNCQSCHTEKSWKMQNKFNHNQHTNYVIDGAHEELKCKDCHVNKNTKVVTYRWPLLKEKTCETCHKNPHIGSFSPDLLKKQCTSCHTTKSWYEVAGKGFDHNKTKFPLTGSHVKTKCSECHGPQGKQVFKFKSAALKFCIDCHRNIHSAQFSSGLKSENCSACHVTTNFNERLKFDHNRTNYKLKGAHSDLECQECHKAVGPKIQIEWPNVKKVESPHVFVGVKFLFPELEKRQCLTCHQDYHKGQLNSNCNQCHSDKSWKPVQFNHNKDSDFPLRFKHTDVKCSECHKPTSEVTVLKNERRPVIRFKPLDSQCVDCHRDPHKGSLGNRCHECHSEQGWKEVRDFHKNYTLTGVHNSLACAECHKQGRKLAGMSQQCYNCHQKDDVHSGTLPNCRECHTQHIWELSRFKHSLTRFPLRGAHRTLDCMDCHKSGGYRGLDYSCVSCHLGDYNEATKSGAAAGHSGNDTNCTNCHRNQFNFKSVVH